MSYNNPYAQNYEMQQPYAQGNENVQEDDFVNFMNSINSVNDSLDHYQSLVNEIDLLQRKLLSEVNEEREQQARTKLDEITADATQLQYRLKQNIKEAQRQAIGDAAKEAQAENSRQRFLKAIQDYRIVEVNYREQSKEQAKRQYRIVQPEATDDEVEAAISDVGGQQIFSQALLNANRRGEAKTALAEVQQRHQELMQLEKTMAELTQLFNDMEQLVIEQQENVEVIDKQVENAQEDVEQGIGHTNKAVQSARRARKNKIRCLIILAVVIAIIVVVIVVPVVTRS